MSKLEKLEMELQKTEETIKKISRKEKIEESNLKSIEIRDKRRKRARHLINIGALFEIIEISHEPYEALLGFILEYKKEFIKNKSKFYEEGKKILEERKNKREQNKKNIEMINSNEIKELLSLELVTQINYVAIMQEKFNKKLLEQLTHEEFLFLKNYKGGIN